MKRSHPQKTTYNKLYLIEEEMYNRILPKLSEVEKQEINDLNENNKPYEDFEENILDKPDASEIIEKPERTENETVTLPVNDISQIPSIPPGQTKKKEKKFACDICVNKMFTTKQSLKRHNKTFHVSKHFIKENEAPSVVDQATLNTVEQPETTPSINLKRKFSDDNESLIEEPVEKSIKYSQGIKRKAPKKASEFMPRKRFHWSSFST